MNINFTLIAQAIMFALFILFTMKLIWPYMLRAIEARQKAIADGLAAAERGHRELEEAKSAAKGEGEREKAAAKAEIEQEFARAREQLRDQVAALAVAGAEKILQREVDAKAHSDLLESIRGQL